ncbi:MAG: S-adenosyl-l-methionine hydroxide adenosyltransferase family protein [Thermoplasmatota archaeon]
MNIITLLSDFGLKDGYVAQMKGVISSLCTAHLIDITHEILPHNIAEGAFILRCVAPYFPKSTIHVGVVDPGVGTNRRGIIVSTDKHVFIGPDNGLLLPAAHLFGEITVYNISNKKYLQNSVSNTFHGRDIFAPVAAYIFNGIFYDEIGEKINNYIDFDFGQAKKQQNSIVGKIIYIDRFGNCITNISVDLIQNDIVYGDKINVELGDISTKILFVQSYGYGKKDDVLAIIGSSNYVEITVNQGSAAKKLSLKEGDGIQLHIS